MITNEPTRCDFTHAVTQAVLRAIAEELATAGVPFEPRDLSVWVASCWPLIEEDPDVTRWALEFVEALQPADVFCP